MATWYKVYIFVWLLHIKPGVVIEKRNHMIRLMDCFFYGDQSRYSHYLWKELKQLIIVTIHTSSEDNNDEGQKVIDIRNRGAINGWWKKGRFRFLEATPSYASCVASMVVAADKIHSRWPRSRAPHFDIFPLENSCRVINSLPTNHNADEKAQKFQSAFQRELITQIKIQTTATTPGMAVRPHTATMGGSRTCAARPIARPIARPTPEAASNTKRKYIVNLRGPLRHAREIIPSMISLSGLMT